MGGYGRVVVGGYSFEITSMCFLAGKLHLTAARPGPMPAQRGQPLTIFGADDLGFAQGGSADLDEIGAGQTGYFTINLALDKCT